MSITYSIWQDFHTDTYEIVRWSRQHGYGEYEIVQRNIRTKEKAVAARNIWRERQQMQDAPAGAKTA